MRCSGGYTRLCEPALDLAQHCARAVQRRIVVTARERLFEQALVPPEQRLYGAEAWWQYGTWRCVREGRVQRGEKIIVLEPIKTLGDSLLLGGHAQGANGGDAHLLNPIA